MKKYLKWILLIIIVALVGVKLALIIKEENEVVVKYEPIVTEASTKENNNVCVALNYNRVRDKTAYDEFLEATLRPDELIKYTVYTDEFIKQIDKLVEEGAYFATLKEMDEFREKGEFPDKCVFLSFGDSDETVYKYVYPILKERKIPFTIFAIVGQVGKGDFDNLKMATWDQLREMNESGLVSFGSHTYDMHYLDEEKPLFLNDQDYEDFYEDIVLSREVIKKELGVDVTSISYPFGEVTDEVVDVVEEAGFTSGYILSPNPIKKNDNAFYQNRYMIDRNNFYEVIVPWLEKQ